MTVAEIGQMLRQANAEEFAALERSLAADSRKGVRAAVEAARRRLALAAAEASRLAGLYEFDRSFLGDGATGAVAGLDEVGRGAVAGPLAVGAVVLPAEPEIPLLNDSKQLSPRQREQVSCEVKRVARVWAVCFIAPADIDRDGMAASLRRAFADALSQVEQAGIVPTVVLIDGNPLMIDERETSVVKGDRSSASIAAASVIAKVARDGYMRELSSTFPQYGFSENKGYASPDHIAAIKRHGLSSAHRASFCKSFMQEALF